MSRSDDVVQGAASVSSRPGRERALANESTRIDHRQIPELVSEQLRDRITHGALRPGERLQMNVLATEFGVSVIPVRDALRTLAAEGLVELQPHRGAIVSRISRRDLEEIFMARVPLEVLVATRAIPHVAPTDLRQLTRLERQMERATEPTQWLAINRQFHMHLYALSGFPRIVRLIDGLWDLMQPYLLAARTDGEGRRDAEREHREMLVAVTHRDAEALKRTLETHLRHTSAKVIPMHDIGPTIGDSSNDVAPEAVPR